MHPTSAQLQDIPQHLLASYRAAGQEHVFRFWGSLSNEERSRLRSDVERVDLDEVAALGRLLTRKAEPARGRRPAPVLRLGEEPAFASRAQAAAAGRELIAKGKVGVFLVAGGQGSRLGFDGPKGCLPFGPLSGKSLFQVHAEKVAALARRHGTRIAWYVQTSPGKNDEETRRFFEAHGCFGLPREDVLFLPQRVLPALTADGKLILESRSRLFLSPNGHGGAYAAFRDGGGLADAERRGLEHLFYFQVDNPLVRIAEPELMGLHSLSGSELTLRVLRKTGPDEKIGVVALEDGLPKVVEYSDLSREEAQLREASGGLAYWAGSIAIHAFRLSFFRSVCEGAVPLPYHVARKKVPALDGRGEPAQVDAAKFETFIFDALPAAKAYLHVECRREEEFAPIKNSSGVDSLDTARDLVVAEHRRWLAAAGVSAPGAVEVSPLAALDAADLARRLDRSGPRAFPGGARVDLDADGAVRAHGA